LFWSDCKILTTWVKSSSSAPDCHSGVPGFYAVFTNVLKKIMLITRKDVTAVFNIAVDRVQEDSAGLFLAVHACRMKGIAHKLQPKTLL